LAAVALALVQGIAVGQPLDATALAQQASAAMRVRDFGTAERIYRQLASSFPEEPGFALNLGLALFSSGKFPAAIEQLDRFIEAHPDHAPAWLLVGMSYQKLDNPLMAVKPLQKALVLEPGNDVARLELADALLRSNQAQPAAQEFARLVGRDSENPKAWLGLGLSYTELSKIAALDLERTAPKSAYHQLLLAQAALAQGRLRSAFTHYRTAEAIDATVPGIHEAIATVYREAGHSDWARAELAKSGELEPCDLRQLECWFASAAYDRILEESHEAVTSDALYWRARAFAEKAKQALTRLVALTPSSAAYRLAATIEDLAGNPRDAADAWRKAVELEPRNLSLRVGLLRALRSAGLHEESIRAADVLLQQRPDSADGRFFTGDALLQLGRVEEAILPLEEAVRLSNGDANMRATLSTAYLSAGRGSEAIPHLEAALQGRENERLLFQLSRAYQAAGRPEDARIALERRSAAIAARPVTAAANEITAP
jgi:tetratricopeptide (TPR) repeat protein